MKKISTPNDINKEISQEELVEILLEVNQKSAKLVKDFAEKQKKTLKLDQVRMNKVIESFNALNLKLMEDPSKLFNKQITFWGDYWALVQESSVDMLFMGMGQNKTMEKRAADKRFRDDEWEANPFFNFIKQCYLLTTRSIKDTIQSTQGLDEKTREHVDFYTTQFLDAFSPSNFITTNPELLKITLETRGANLIKGLKHLLADLERGPCQIQVNLTDLDAFEVGKNLAVTPGKVIYNNDLIQLIQYAPTTAKVDAAPILIVPPWINKYYILDLTEKNSLVKWLVDQGNTVFMISWVNPDENTGDKSFEDYMREGPVAAVHQIEKVIPGEPVHMMGYCMGGTLLSCGAAYLSARRTHRIKSLTLMACLLDFANPGEIGVFIDEAQINAMEEQMQKKGYLDGCMMSNSFNMLRSNDLIWSAVVNNYLKGAPPIPFDILFWNADATNMPAKMHGFYLRNMYLNNRLREKGGILLDQVPIDLSQIKVPVYFISTREDHIAPWRSTYSGSHLMGGPVRFVLGGSGHVAGIVNPPAKNKYGYWINDAHPDLPEDWMDASQFQEGSWWNDWRAWHDAMPSTKVAARQVGKGIEDAPGCYAQKRLDRPESGVCYITDIPR